MASSERVCVPRENSMYNTENQSLENSTMKIEKKFNGILQTVDTVRFSDVWREVFKSYEPADGGFLYLFRDDSCHA